MTKEAHKKPKKHVSHQAAHAGTKKVFDITRPGKSPASPTSRPVVASPKPPVADDQFVPSAPPLRASDPSAKHELMDPKRKKTLQPTGAPETATPVTSAESTAPSLPVSAPIADTSASSTVAVKTSAAAPPAVPAAPTPSEPKAATPPKLVELADVESAISAQTPRAIDAAVASVAATPTPETSPQDETPAHLALEQTVDAKDVPIWEHPDISEQVDSSSAHASRPDDKGGKAKSIEDLLAETGAPVLEPEKAPSLIVSHHHAHHSWWTTIFVFFLVLIVGVIILDLLLDAGIIKTGLDVPYTDFL